MLRTCEIRWFFQTAPFDRSLLVRETAEAAPRTDWYAPPADPRCGVKAREGQLETKLLVQDDGVRVMGLATGRMQTWSKWSLAFPPNEFPAAELLAATGWVPVNKRRFLRSFRYHSGDVAEVDPQEDADCQFEWTELAVRGAPYWTIGLEAFRGPGLGQVLLCVAARVLQDLPGGTCLAEENSASYPAWLRTLLEGEYP